MLIGRSVEAESLLLWTATVLLYELHLVPDVTSAERQTATNVLVCFVEFCR